MSGSKEKGENEMKKICFTLIELLLVVSVLSILFALLLPALQAAREKGKMISCNSNLKQIAFFSSLYQNDFNGFVGPQCGMNTGIGRYTVYYHWDYYYFKNYLSRISPLKNEITKVFSCPSEKRREAKHRNHQLRSYAPPKGWIQNNDVPAKPQQIKNTSRGLLFTETNNANGELLLAAVGVAQSDGEVIVNGTIQMGNNHQDSKRRPSVCVDGHVEHGLLNEACGGFNTTAFNFLQRVQNWRL